MFDNVTFEKLGLWPIWGGGGGCSSACSDEQGVDNGQLQILLSPEWLCIGTYKARIDILVTG